MTQKGINGLTIIREDFNNEDAANTGSKETQNVIVDINLKRLSIKSKNNKPLKNIDVINTKYIDCFHYNALESGLMLYPNSEDLSHGAFWDINGNVTQHFTEKNTDKYKNNILENKVDIKESISSCQFESVMTVDVNSDLEKRIEKRFALEKNIPETNVLINRAISVNGKYITKIDKLPQGKVKLRIPFKDAILSTGCEIVLNPNENNEWPVLDSINSYVKAFIDVNGSLVSQNIGLTSMTTDTIDDFGSTKIYSILFNQALIPDMLELVFSYNNGWAEISYNMSEYYYSTNRTVEIEATLGDTKLGNKNITYTQSVHILVDKSIVNEKTNVENVFNDDKGVK